MFDMNANTLLKKSEHQAVAAKVSVVLAALLGVFSLSSQAQQSSAQFDVVINLQNSGGSPIAGLCRSGTNVGTIGSTVSVDCMTGNTANFSGNTLSLPSATIQNIGSYRFMLNSYGVTELLDTVDNFSGVSTIITWRTIYLSNRDYLEMMVHW
jgi:hypothetical protein